MTGLAVVGLGLAGGVMCAAVRAHPSVRLVAGVDVDADVRSRFAQAEGLPALATLDEALLLSEVDAVYIATPHHLHREQVERSAGAGRHVVVEKPMALSVSDCDAMIAACATAGVALVVGHTHGFAPAVGAIADVVAGGRFGRLGLVSTWNYTDYLYRPRRPEELDTAAGGGIMFNQVPHQVDIIRTVARSPVASVRAYTQILDPERPTEGMCTAVIGFADGAAASLVYSGYDHFDSDTFHDWVSEGGTPKRPDHASARRALEGLSGDDERRARTEHLSYGRRPAALPPHQPHFGELVVSCAGADLRPGVDDVVAYTDRGVEHLPVAGYGGWPGRGGVLDELETAVGGGIAVHDGVFGRETVRVCLALLESARDGREVAVGGDTFHAGGRTRVHVG